MTWYNKLKWILGILVVFLLIVTTNLIDKNNFVRVRDSVVTIYEDRLLAKELIFDMLKAIQRKEVAVKTTDSTFFKIDNYEVNVGLQSAITKFSNTKLTVKEAHVFKDFKDNITSLLQAENQFINSSFQDKSNVVKSIDALKENIDDLSKIQIEEGQKQMYISKRAIDTIELFTQVEIYFLVFMAIIIQIIVMYNPKKNKS